MKTEKIALLLIMLFTSLGTVFAMTELMPASPIFTVPGPQLGISLTGDIVSGDVNGDNALDLLAANRNVSQIWINQQDGQFGFGQSFSLATVNTADLGDLDGDNDLDIVFGSGLHQVHIWLNDGSGVFTDTGQLLGSSQVEYLDVALGDLDGDSDLDLFLATNQANEVWLNGEGGQPIAVFSKTAQNIGDAYSNEVKLVDLDQDNDLDAVVANGSNSRRASEVWLNDGTGLFQDNGQDLGFSWDIDVSAADVDSDNDVDLIFASYVGTDTLWLNQGMGTFTLSGQTFYSGNSGSVALGDLDGDGDNDAIFGRNFQQPNEVWINQGGVQGGNPGHFANNGEALDTDAANWDTLLADFDGDADLDVVFANNGSNNVYWNGFVYTPTADLMVTSCCSGNRFVQTSLFGTGFTFTVTNQGPAVAHNVTLNFTGGNATAVSNSGDGVCVQTPQRVCTFGSLAPGDSVRVTSGMQGQATTFNYAYVGTLGDAAWVAATEADPNWFNNASEERKRFYNCGQAGCAIEDIFCLLNASSRQPDRRGSALWRQMMARATASEFVPDLFLYYQVRDWVMLPTAEGRSYHTLYAEHNQEILSLLLAEPALWDASLAALEAWEPHLQLLVDGEGETAVITAAQVQVLDTFLTDLAAAGSPELQTAIGDARAQLPPLADFIGMTVQDARTAVVGTVVYLPVVHRGE